MMEPETDTLMFFDRHPGAVPLYLRFEEAVCAAFPKTNKRVQKTQITFSNRHVFACVSFARVKRKAELPEPYIVITLGLPYPLASARVAAKTEVYPGRWTTHFVLCSETELDGELLAWLEEAYEFSERK